jgi:hypothetical protein
MLDVITMRATATLNGEHSAYSVVTARSTSTRDARMAGKMAAIGPKRAAAAAYRTRFPPGTAIAVMTSACSELTTPIPSPAPIQRPSMAPSSGGEQVQGLHMG